MRPPTSRPVRIAVVNRGEAATRFLETATDLRGLGWNLTSIALHTHADRHDLFVRRANEAYNLDHVAPATGTTTTPGYRDHGRIIAALLACRADMAWVGWGFVAEDADFADACRAAGVEFIGPSGEAMRLVADKARAKALASSAGVPVIPWSEGPVATLKEALAHTDRIGFPLLVKSAAGGGGMGIREVADVDALGPAMEAARQESQRAFGDGTLFLERRIDVGRHVEVQVLADGHGTVWPVGLRECSIQRRRQKLVEESGMSQAVPRVEARLREYAVRICQAAGYRNAGTVEFLVDEHGEPFFMEVNARLQVEHTVTEMTTGLDLVAEQIKIAMGEPLRGGPPAVSGHAIEVRVNAEDPADGFRPAPGTVTVFRPAGGPGVRVDTGVVQGDRISREYDSMIAKVIAWGADRDMALARLRRAVDQTELVIEGGTSNRSFLLDILEHPDVASGEITTRWLDDLMAGGRIVFRARPEIALLLAALEQFRDGLATERAHFVRSALGGQPDVADGPQEPASLACGADRHTFTVHETRDGAYDVLVDGRHRIRVELDRVDGRERTVRVAGERHPTHVSAAEGGYAVEVDGVTHRVSAEDQGVVRAGFSGMVVRVDIAVGKEVAAGDVLAVVESMKLENQICAPIAGRVEELLIASHSQVSVGQILIRLAPAGVVDAHTTGLDFAALSCSEGGGAGEPLEDLDAVILGLTVTDGTLDGLAARLGRTPARDGRLDREIASLRLLCDMHGLSGADLGQYVRGAETARRVDPSLKARLDAALRHFDARAVPGDAQDDECLRLMRICRSSRRITAIEQAVSAVLRRWLDGDVLEGEAAASVSQRLAAAMETRAPALSGLARTAQARLSVEPRLDEEHAAPRRVRDALTARDPGLRDPASLTSMLLTSRAHEIPWETWVPGALRDGALDPEVALGCFVASTYRAPAAWQRIDPDGLILAGHVGIDADRQNVVVALCDHAPVEALAQYVADCAGEGPVVVELLTADATGVADAGVPGAERTTVTVLPATDGGRSMSSTLRYADGGWARDHGAPGLHPAVARRLEAWRLGGFELTPATAPPGLRLFAGTSREDPRDKRLFALAEIADLGITRDAAGGVVSIIGFERALTRCFNAFRHHDSGFPSRTPYGWNRVTIYLDPLWDLPIDELRAAAARVADGARGLSLDQVVVRMRRAVGDEIEDIVVHMVIPAGPGIQIGFKGPSSEKVPTLRGHRRAAAEMRRRGLIHPWEIVRLLTSPGASHSDLPPGEFVELELNGGRLEPIDREPATNVAGVVVGLISNVTAKHPEGVQRVAILNDPSKGLASLGEAECSRILAALRLAEERGVPVEWLAVSSGARVSMDSGTENLDWTARVLRQIVEMTQRGHEINVVLTGVNVGAQSYWDAEATMLMHTKGVLIAVADNAMVLTGKQALDFSGAVSAASNTSIGGYERIMGPNGQAQYWTPRIEEACQLLLRHYDFSYIAPGEHAVRPRPTTDVVGRSAAESPHELPGSELTLVGDIFCATRNPDRKKPFNIRSVMTAVADLDDAPLERWPDMLDAENTVIWDIHVGGHASTVIGIESQDLPRRSPPPIDGPGRWTSGTLFPQSSKKVARAINAARGVRPVVVLANLSGFDGSPESMRELQLESGSEIGRAVINFRGPLIFVVLTRYHGGAFVVFSKTLNDQLEVIAVEGARASVLGGAPAAAVVFGREVAHRATGDPRVQAARRQLDQAAPVDRPEAEDRLGTIEQTVRTELRGALGAEFDAIHTIERARDVGSVDRIVAIDDLRPAIIEAIQRGMNRAETCRK